MAVGERSGAPRFGFVCTANPSVGLAGSLVGLFCRIGLRRTAVGCRRLGSFRTLDPAELAHLLQLPTDYCLFHHAGTEGEFLGAGTADEEKRRGGSRWECRDLSSQGEPRSRTACSVLVRA